MGGGGFVEPVDDIKSPPLDELHSLWVLLFLACPSSILSSPCPLYIRRAFFQPPAPSTTHTHTHICTPFPLDGGGGVMSSLCSDGTLLHASLPHKFALIDSRRSHMLTNRSFCGCERGCVWVDVCPPTPRQTFCHRQHRQRCTHQCSPKWLDRCENNKMVTFLRLRSQQHLDWC